MVFRGVVPGVACLVVLAAPLSAGGGRPDGRGGAGTDAGPVEPGPIAPAAVRLGQVSPAAEPAARCDVSPGSSDETIVVGRLLLGGDGAEPGAVLVAGGRIAAVGEPAAVRSSAPEATVIDCGAAWVSPGLVNPHEHPNVSGGFPDPGMRPAYSHREQWQGRAGDEHYPLKYARTEAPVQQLWIEFRHLLAGTTTLGGSGAAAGLLKTRAGRTIPPTSTGPTCRRSPTAPPPRRSPA